MTPCERTRAGVLCGAPADVLDLRCPHCRTHIIIAVCDRHLRMKCAACGNLSGLGRWAERTNTTNGAI